MMQKESITHVLLESSLIDLVIVIWLFINENEYFNFDVFWVYQIYLFNLWKQNSKAK